MCFLCDLNPRLKKAFYYLTLYLSLFAIHNSLISNLFAHELVVIDELWNKKHYLHEEGNYVRWEGDTLHNLSSKEKLEEIAVFMSAYLEVQCNFSAILGPLSKFKNTDQLISVSLYPSEYKVFVTLDSGAYMIIARCDGGRSSTEL